MDPLPSPDEPVVGQITLRYWAAARSAAGVAEDQVDVAGPVSLAWLVGVSVERHRAVEGFERLLAGCSVLIGDRPVASSDPAAVLVSPEESVEFLPPFAGG
jgi:molybdopterin synthase sulfur carrier subunit